ncbi:hypothetical protein Tco_0311716 [Tanacetum coccineum]
MELENTQNNALAKLPMLKLREYEMWEIRIKQYFQIQDYALWEVIENGNSMWECKAPRSKDNRKLDSGSSTKTVKIEDASEKAMCAIDGVGFDWSDMQRMSGRQANMALMAFSDSEKGSGFEFKDCKFDKSAKDLNEMLESQITDKSKKGVGLKDSKNLRLMSMVPRDFV